MLPPKSPHLDAGVFEQEEVVHHSLLFLRRQGDDQRREQQLAGDVAVAGRQLFIELPLVGGVLVDQAQLVPPLGDDVRAERFPHIFQFGGGVRAGQDRLLRLDKCCILRRGFWLRGGRTLRQRAGPPAHPAEGPPPLPPPG